MTLLEHRENALLSFMMIAKGATVLKVVPEFLHYYNEETEEYNFDQEMWDFITSVGLVDVAQTVEERGALGTKIFIDKRLLVSFIYF